LKKIIWAPHHSIREEGGEFDFSSFLKYSDFIPELASRFKDQIQIAFKPHPLLKNKLYAGDVWGRERTDAYYASWDKMENCQLCETDYTDLFLGSDGMIFDSISFIAEYLYINKPGLFTMTNSRIYDQLNDFGKVTISQHYHAFNENDIVNFVERVILAGEDTGKATREAFIMSELCSPGTDTAAERIYRELEKNI
jgi:CDP-glycerol glycerophosphotransferase (TagB/SpsB family)